MKISHGKAIFSLQKTLFPLEKDKISLERRPFSMEKDTFSLGKDRFSLEKTIFSLGKETFSLGKIIFPDQKCLFLVFLAKNHEEKQKTGIGTGQGVKITRSRLHCWKWLDNDFGRAQSRKQNVGWRIFERIMQKHFQ